MTWLLRLLDRFRVYPSQHVHREVQVDYRAVGVLGERHYVWTCAVCDWMEVS